MARRQPCWRLARSYRQLHGAGGDGDGGQRVDVVDLGPRPGEVGADDDLVDAGRLVAIECRGDAARANCRMATSTTPSSTYGVQRRIRIARRENSQPSCGTCCAMRSRLGCASTFTEGLLSGSPAAGAPRARVGLARHLRRRTRASHSTGRVRARERRRALRPRHTRRNGKGGSLSDVNAAFGRMLIPFKSGGVVVRRASS